MASWHRLVSWKPVRKVPLQTRVDPGGGGSADVWFLDPAAAGSGACQTILFRGSGQLSTKNAGTESCWRVAFRSGIFIYVPRSMECGDYSQRMGWYCWRELGVLLPYIRKAVSVLHVIKLGIDYPIFQWLDRLSNLRGKFSPHPFSEAIEIVQRSLRLIKLSLSNGW